MSLASTKFKLVKKESNSPHALLGSLFNNCNINLDTVAAGTTPAMSKIAQSQVIQNTLDFATTPNGSCTQHQSESTAMQAASSQTGMGMGTIHCVDYLGQNQQSLPQVPGFVNAYLIIDPVTQSVWLPQQVLTCVMNGQTLSAQCGPTILNNFPKDQLSSLNQSVRNVEPQPLVQPPAPLQIAGNGEFQGNKGSKSFSEMVESKVSETQSSSCTRVTPEIPKESNDTNIKSKTKSSALCIASVLTKTDVDIGSSSESDRNTDKKSGALEATKTSNTELQSDCNNSKSINFQTDKEGNLLPPVPEYPPIKALTAYNFYFRDEREALMNGTQDFDWSDDKRNRILKNHWYRDRKAKRRHRKTEGKIAFSTLSRIISQRWKVLPREGKDFYRDVAQRDWERYKNEVRHFKSLESFKSDATAED